MKIQIDLYPEDESKIVYESLKDFLDTLERADGQFEDQDELMAALKLVMDCYKIPS